MDPSEPRRPKIHASDGPKFVGPPAPQKVLDRITRKYVEDPPSPTRRFGIDYGVDGGVIRMNVSA